MLLLLTCNEIKRSGDLFWNESGREREKEKKITKQPWLQNGEEKM